MRGIGAFVLAAVVAATACDEDAQVTAAATGAATSGPSAGGGTTSSAGGAGGSGGSGGSTTGPGGSGGLGGGAPTGSQSAYFWGDFVVNGEFRLGYADYPAGTVSVLMPMGLSGGFVHRVAVDDSQLAIAGSDTVISPAVLAIYGLEATSTPLILVDAAVFPNAFAFFDDVALSPDGTLVAFSADLDLAGARSAYVVPSDGSSDAVRLSPAPSQSGLNVEVLRWADATHVVYAGDVVQNQSSGLWIVDTAAPAALALLPTGMLSPTQGVAIESLEIDDLGRIYFRSDHQEDDRFGIYRVDPNGGNLEQVSGTALSNGSGEASVGGWSISPDGGSLAFFADAPLEDLAQLYLLDLSTSSATLISALQSAPLGDYTGDKLDRPSWAPDSSKLAVITDWLADDEFEVFLVPTGGAPGGLRILGVAANGQTMDAVQAELSSDGLRLFVRGDLRANNFAELFSTSDLTTADQLPADLVIQEVPASNGAVAGFVLTP
jgi:hypothetical protein